jgi:tetratricopeptide (TPR) repeat protein
MRSAATANSMAAGRNDPCPCGSGRKYKHCCGRPDAAAPTAVLPEAGEAGTLAALLSQGRLREAEERASALLRAQPESALLWKILGVAQLRQNKDARAALRRAAELLPEDAEAHRNLGGALHDRGEWEAALVSLRHALNLEPRNPQALTDAGDAQRSLGRPREAITLYQRALQIEPRRREALNNLGNAFLDVGEPAQAVRCYGQALKLKPDDAPVLCNLGNALRQLGQLPQAEACSRRAIALAPETAMAHNNLGLCLAGQGQRGAAIASYRQALKLNPRYVEALANLGDALWEEGERPEALTVYQQAVQLDPRRADSHYHLGCAQLDSRRIVEAIASFQQALAAQPNHALAHLGLAAAQRVQGLFAEAAASCQAALALEPNRPEALQLLGELRADRGQFAEAQELWQRTIKLHPQFIPAYGSVAAHRRMTAQDVEWLNGAQGLLSQPLPLNDEIHLRYALGKYFDDTGRFDEAFSHYRQANELTKRYRGGYDGAKLTARIERIMRLCQPARFQQTRRYASDSERPVFVVGMPRSGTSLAEQILASHPAVFGAGEIRFWDKAFEKLEAAAREPAELASTLPGVARAYLERLGVHAAGEERIIDKMPANFLYAGLIHAAFPRARIIHMRRQPLDTCVSVYFQNFFNVSAYANDLESLAHYYGEYLRICAYWRSVLPGTALLEVPYEGLIEDQEGWSRRMVEFIGLSWDPRCLDFHRTERVVITASRWQVRQRLHAGSIGRWRNYAKYLAPLQHLVQLQERTVERAG